MRISLPLAVLCALALAWVTGPSLAQDKEKVDKRALSEAYGPVKAMIADKKLVDETVAQIKKCDGLLDYKAAIELLGFFEETDRAWDSAEGDKNAPKESRGRPVNAYKIATAILDCVRKMTYATEVIKFAEEDDLNNTEKFSLRPRMAMLDAIARSAGKDEDCMKFLIEYCRDAENKADTDLRILAINHLADYPSNTEVPVILMVALKDRSWRIRDVAIDALAKVAGKTSEDQIILALINQLAVESGKLRENLRNALRKITGERLGTDSDEWSEWFKNKKRSEQGLPEKKGGDKGTRVKVFKTESFSDRYVFVLDTSVSMLKKITDEEKEKLKKSISGDGDDKDPRRPLDWSLINCKLDLAREEMIRSLEVMDPEKTRFTLITFAEKITVWKDELVPTEPKIVNEVADYLRAIKGGKTTNIWGALDKAYDLSEQIAGVDTDKRKPKKRDKVVTGPHRDEALPDTIYLYTDGWATYGKYAGDDKNWQKFSQEEKSKMYHAIMKEMKEELKDRNRVSRMTIHCIGVGDPQDNYTLKDIASMTRGEYIAIGK